MSSIGPIDNKGTGTGQHYSKERSRNEAKKKALKALPLNRSIRDIYVPQDQAVNVSASYAKDPKLQALAQRQASRTMAGPQEDAKIDKDKLDNG